MIKAELSIAPALVRNLFAYDATTGLVSRKIARGGMPIGALVGCMRADGYLVVAVNKRLILLHRVAWCVEHGSWPKGVIDHINGQRADNRLANLRDVSQTLNMLNQHKRRRSASGVAGVDEIGGRYRARMKAMHSGRRASPHIGMFDTLHEAAEAYQRAKADVLGQG